MVLGLAFAVVAAAVGGNRLANVASIPEYAPADGGFAIEDGTAEFCRPLYGWLGNDEMKRPVKPIMWASDRPRVRLSCHPPKRQNPDLGTLSFGDGAERVRFAYVRGRAEYELKDRGTVTLVRAVGSDDLLAKVTGGLKPAFDGEWIQRGAAEKNGAAYYAFARKGCKDAPVADLPKAFADGVAKLDRISRAIETKTPDARLDALVACQNVAADALFEGPIICHGATGWHCAYGGWRGAYAAVALGWDEAFKTNARLYFKAQKPDGRIPCQPWREGIYNMNEVFVDAVLRYWLRSGDDAFLKECAYEGVKGHLGWMERTMKDPSTGLFENWLDAWNTDNKWCNGGAGTIATAYTLFAYETMAKAAAKLGRTEDAKAFAARAAEIRSLVYTWLWSAEKGVWGEYRERFGHRRLNDCPDTSTIYTAIDSGLAAAHPDRAASALAWVERNVPSVILGDGTSMILSSHKLPLFYSTCGRYAQETMHLALAYWLVGEPEIAARHFRGAICGGWRGESAGPGALATTYTEKLTNDGSTDFGDTVGIFLRTVVEGVFGIRVDAPSGTVTVMPGFPSDWDRASIRTPYLAYDWTRANGVKVTANPHGWRVRIAPPAPKLVGERLPKPHRRWGSPKGEGTDTSVASGMRFEHVDLSSVFNQNWRTLHVREYGPRIADFVFNDWTPPRTLTAHGRSWWESPNSSDEASNVRGGRNVPDKMAWPADGVVRSKTGVPFRLAGHDEKNAAFVSLYEQFPDRLEIPLSGKASKLALLTALSTNPNQGWMEAARFAVAYADGTSEVLPLVPPDNCDDWLNYLQSSPYHLTGEHVMFHERAHANVLALRLDPAKELKALTLECVGTETFAGLVAATLVRPDQAAGLPCGLSVAPLDVRPAVLELHRENPGATGSVIRAENGWRVKYDFSQGGGGVGLRLPLAKPQWTRKVSFRGRLPEGLHLTVLAFDATGQCFRKVLEDAPCADGRWSFDTVSDWLNSWGGCRDGVFHYPVTSVEVVLDRRGVTAPNPQMVGEAWLGDFAVEEMTPAEREELAIDGKGVRGVRYLVTDFTAGDRFAGGPRVFYDPSRDKAFANGVIDLDFSSRPVVSLFKEIPFWGSVEELQLAVEAPAEAAGLEIELEARCTGQERSLSPRLVVRPAEPGRSCVFQTFALSAPYAPDWRTGDGRPPKRVSTSLRIGAIYIHKGKCKAKRTELRLARLEATVRGAVSRPVLLADPPTGAEPPRTLSVGLLALDGKPVARAVRVELSDWEGHSLGTVETGLPPPDATGRSRAEVALPHVPDGLNFVSYACTAHLAGRSSLTVKPYVTSWTRPVAAQPASAAKRPDLPWGIGAYIYRSGDFTAFGPGYGHTEDAAAFARMERRAALAAAAGFRWVRADVEPYRVWRGQGKYDFSFCDRMLEILERHGLSVCGGLSASDLAGFKRYTPAYYEQYAQVAQAYVRRYRGRISDWEVWNEPNIGFWKGPKEDYPKLVDLVYDAVKAADPSARIVAGSMAGIGLEFLDMCRKAEMKFDTLSIHPYRGNPHERQLLADYASVTNRSRGAKLYLTEFGWPTGVGMNTYSEIQQAAYYARCYLASAGSGLVHSAYGYNLLDDGFNIVERENNFGIVRRDFTPKPAYRALAKVCRTFTEGRPSLEPVACANGVTAWIFRMGGQAAIWADADIWLEVKTDGPARFTNLMDERLPSGPSVDVGPLKVVFSDRPVTGL